MFPYFYESVDMVNGFALSNVCKLSLIKCHAIKTNKQNKTKQKKQKKKKKKTLTLKYGENRVGGVFVFVPAQRFK